MPGRQAPRPDLAGGTSVHEVKVIGNAAVYKLRLPIRISNTAISRLNEKEMGNLRRPGTWGFQFWLYIVVCACASCSDKGTPQGPAPSQGAGQTTNSVSVSIGDVNLTMREIISQQEDMQGLQPTVDFAQDIRVTLEDSLIIFPLPDSGWGGRHESTGWTTSFVTIKLKPTRLEVVETQILSGEMRFDMHNNMPEDVRIKLYFDDIKRNEVINVSDVIPANAVKTVRLPLGGTVFRPQMSSSGSDFINNISGNMDVETTGLRLLSERMVDWYYVPSPIAFNTLTGRIVDMRIPFQTGPVEVSLPPDFQGIQSATLEINLANGIIFSKELNLTLVAREDTTGGRSISLNLPEELRPLVEGNPDNPVLATLRLDETNTNIVELLNLKPEVIEISGDILLGSVNQSEVRRTDGIDIQVAIRSPLEAAFEEHTAVSEPKNISVNTVTRGRIAKATGGTLTLDLTNGLTIGIGIRLLIGTDAERLLESPVLTVPREGDIAVGAAPVDAATGLVREPVVHREQVTLTAAEAALFSRSRLKSLMVIMTESTNGRKVRIVDSDAVKMSVQARMQVTE